MNDRSGISSMDRRNHCYATCIGTCSCHQKGRLAPSMMMAFASYLSMYGVDADIVSDEIAPRRSLSSVSAATHRPTLGVDALVDDVDAPRRSLSSASAAPRWPTLDVGDVLVDGVKQFSTGDIALPSPSSVGNFSPLLPRGDVTKPRIKVRELFLRAPHWWRSIINVVMLVEGDLGIVDLEIDESSASRHG